MESRVQSNRDKRGRPYTIRWVHQEPSADTSNTVADEVSRQCNEDLVGNVGGVRLVEILGKVLDPDDVVGIWRVVGDISHDCDEHVFLFGEWSRVQTVASAENCEAPIREPSLGGFSDRVGKKLGDVGHDPDGRLSNVEQLVDESE